MIARRFTLVLLAPLLGALACGDRATTKGSEPTTGVVRGAVFAEEERITGSDLQNKELVLTFDDGPGSDAVTGELARWLSERGIKATFFVNGACVGETTLSNESYCDEPVANAAAVLAEIKAKGHTVANHTTTHRNLVTQVPDDEIVPEVAETHALIAPYLPAWNRWFLRAPFGSWHTNANPSPHSLISADPQMRNYVGPIYWTMGGGDDGHIPDWKCWDPKYPYKYTTKECGDGYLAEIRATEKGIVLMHDSHGNTGNHELETGIGNTVDMVKYIVRELAKEPGWTFKALEQVPSVAAAMQKCDAACASCTGPNAGQCETCDPGKFVASGVCTACDAACVTCSGAGPTACLSCPPGKHVVAGACVDDVCSSCPASTPLGPDGAPLGSSNDGGAGDQAAPTAATDGSGCRTSPLAGGASALESSALALLASALLRRRRVR